MDVIIDAKDARGEPVIFTSGSEFSLDYVLSKNRQFYNLQGKTVTATIRAEDDEDTVISGAFEGLSLTPGGGTTPAAFGGVAAVISAASSSLLGPQGVGGVEQVTKYVVSTSVTTDNYKASQLLRIRVRSDVA